MDTIKEKDIIYQLKQENTKALEKLISNYSNYVFKVVRAYMGTGLREEDVEEIVSDVFFTLWKSKDKLDETKHIKPYIAAIARNTALKKLRDKKDVDFLPEDFSKEDSSIDITKDIQEKEKSETVFSAIQALDKETQNIFLRFYYLGQTTLEVSKATKINPSTIMSKLSRGRKKLKQILLEGGYDNEEPLR